MDRPISRMAMAKRVTESIMSSTFLPFCEKYSAMAVATKAPRMRNKGDWSEVTATITECSRPAGPRSRSMNSFTSRPRSPISAITLISALA